MHPSPKDFAKPASTLGASPFRVWQTVDFPILARATLSAATFAFTVSLGEFGATLLITRPEYPTIPIAISRFLSQPGGLNYGQAMAMATVLMLLTTLSILLLFKNCVSTTPENSNARTSQNALVKSYEGKPLLTDISFTVADGETVCLLGASGSGKSTILRMIAGLDFPERGAILLNSLDLAGTPPHLRDFGLVFQDYGLFPHLNVFDNIAFGLKMRNASAEEIKQRVTLLLEQFKLAGFETRSITDLSGGEQQRVALARALAPVVPVDVRRTPWRIGQVTERRFAQRNPRHFA